MNPYDDFRTQLVHKFRLLAFRPGIVRQREVQIRSGIGGCE